MWSFIVSILRLCLLSVWKCCTQTTCMHISTQKTWTGLESGRGDTRGEQRHSWEWGRDGLCHTLEYESMQVQTKWGPFHKRCNATRGQTLHRVPLTHHHVLLLALLITLNYNKAVRWLVSDSGLEQITKLSSLLEKLWSAFCSAVSTNSKRWGSLVQSVLTYSTVTHTVTQCQQQSFD